MGILRRIGFHGQSSFRGQCFCAVQQARIICRSCEWPLALSPIPTH
ncbi:hypothetical protein BF49_0706 [Bradyrhizobium sp.]|nr:hypothetical protein BF49_0706 [Bradyrhizobium sp.]